MPQLRLELLSSLSSKLDELGLKSRSHGFDDSVTLPQKQAVRKEAERKTNHTFSNLTLNDHEFTEYQVSSCRRPNWKTKRNFFLLNNVFWPRVERVSLTCPLAQKASYDSESNCYQKKSVLLSFAKVRFHAWPVSFHTLFSSSEETTACVTSRDPKMQIEEEIECTLHVCPSLVSVFKIPPRGIGGQVSGEWKVVDKLWEGRIRITAKGTTCFIRFEDISSGELFAVAPVPLGKRLNYVEPACDSSRYIWDMMNAYPWVWMRDSCDTAWLSPECIGHHNPW